MFINARPFSLPRLSESCGLGLPFEMEALIALFWTNLHLIEIPAARDVIDTLFPAVDVTLYRTVWSISAKQPLPTSPIPRRYKLPTPHTQASIARCSMPSRALRTRKQKKMIDSKADKELRMKAALVAVDLAVQWQHPGSFGFKLKSGVA